MLADGRYCYPLTITDYASRYVMACDALPTTKERFAFTVFERAFKTFGLPDSIRIDNGIPFASPNSLFNLSKLSVWWLRLGLRLERIKPGCPQQNGRHDRMHLTLKREATRPATTPWSSRTSSTPTASTANARSRASTCRRRPISTVRQSEPIVACGTATTAARQNRDHHHLWPHLHRKAQGECRQVFAGQSVGVKEAADRIWLVSFMHYDLGFFDDETCRLEPAANPFDVRNRLPMSRE